MLITFKQNGLHQILPNRSFVDCSKLSYVYLNEGDKVRVKEFQFGHSPTDFIYFTNCFYWVMYFLLPGQGYNLNRT